MATAFVELVKRSNTQSMLSDAPTQAQQAALVNWLQNILRYNGENPTVNDYANVNSLGASQVGNGATTNFLDCGSDQGLRAGGLIRITTTVGATPTCTYLIQGSDDHSNWKPVEVADSVSPTSFSKNTFTLTSAGTKLYFIKPVKFRYYQVTFSANTNVTNTVDAVVF